MENSLSFFCLNDLKRFFFEKKYYLICIFFLFFIFTAIFVLTLEPEYEAKASFFEDLEKTQKIGNLKDMVLSDNSSVFDAFSFLKTKSLNKKLVEKLGLQISVIDERNKFRILYHNFLKNLKIYFEGDFQQEEIEFSNVLYEKEFANYLHLKFLDNRSFEIFDSNNNFMGKKNIYETIKIKDICFTVNKIPQKYVEQTIKIKIDPWDKSVDKVINNIKITKDKTSPNFLFLKTKNTKKLYATKTLNVLMELYHEYLVEENENSIEKQIVYLEKRKRDLEKELYLVIEENEKQIAFNAKTKGFTDINTEVNNLLIKRENYQRFLEQITKDLDYLKNVNFKDVNRNVCLDENVLNIIDKIKRLEDEKQTLQVAIEKDLSTKKNVYSSAKSKVGLDKLINDKKNIDELIENININNPIEKNVMFFDFEKDNILITSSKKKTNFINNKVNLFEFNDFKFNKKKLSILDLSKAKELYYQLNRSKKDLKLEISQLDHILKNVKIQDFRFNSISPFLSQDLIKNIIDISKKIEDDQNYTKKEIETLKQEYNLEKKYIITFLEEILNLKKLNLNILNQKLFSLKKLQVNLIANEIVFLSTKVKEHISKVFFEKTNEKEVLEQNIKNIKNEMQSLVCKKSLENKLNMKAEMTKNMIDSITKLIESKKLDLNLKAINSKPIDLATVNIFSIHIFRNSFIIAILFVFIFFIIYLYIVILKGFPLSEGAIKSLFFDYCGKISFKCDGIEVKKLKSSDLESLRKVIVCIDKSKHKIITSIGSKGPNFIHYLAALLTIVGKKILVIETNSKIDEKDGLFPFLEKNKKKLPIQKIQAYDFLPSGKKKYFAFELLKSFKFLEKIEHIKSKYDLILLYSDAKIDSAEVKIYLEFSDKVILTFKKETLEDIQFFINWAKEKAKLCFVTY